MEEFYLDSCGAGRLHCALWKPEGEPKAVVQLLSLIHISEPTRH